MTFPLKDVLGGVSITSVCSMSTPVSRYIVHVFHRSSLNVWLSLVESVPFLG